MKLKHNSINYSVDTVDALLTLVGEENDVVVVTDENRGGTFVYKSADSATNNDGTIFNGWTRQYDGAVNAKWFGAKGDGVTDDTVAFNQALAGTDGDILIDNNSTFVINETISEENRLRLVGYGLLMENSELNSPFIKVGLNRSDADNTVSGGLIIGGTDTNTGTLFKGGGNPAWPKIKPMTKASPQQFQIYANAIQGIAYPSASNQITKEYGDDLSLDLIRAGDRFWWNKVQYEVVSKISDSIIELQNIGGGSPSFTVDPANKQPFYYLFEITESVVNVSSGGIITWKSGDVFSGSNYSTVIINGTQYDTVSIDSTKQATITGYSGGEASSVSCIFKNRPIAEYISLLRLQALYGLSEETFAMYTTPDGYTILENQYAGDGSYNPLIFRSGETDDYYNEIGDLSSARVSMNINSDGKVTFGNGFSGSDTNSRVSIKNQEKTTVAMAVGGNTRSDLLSLGVKFNSDATQRKMSFGIFNDYTGGFIQGEDLGGSHSAIQIQPYDTTGSQLFIGKHNNFNIDSKVVIGDPTEATLAHTAMIAPAQDNKYSIGLSLLRPSVIYSATGTINTSDDREKTYLTNEEVETLVAKELKGLVKKFKFNDAIEAKGEDNARIHYGTSAQSVIEVFKKHNLDPMKYAMICYDEWEEEVDKDGNVIQEAGNRYGIRYEELIMFIIGGL